MTTVRRKEIECHDLPFKTKPIINLTVTATADSVPENCSDIKYFIQCPEYIRSKSRKEHIRSNYGSNNDLIHSDKEWWMNHVITEACCICGGGTQKDVSSSSSSAAASLSSSSYTHIPKLVEHDRLLNALQERGFFFFIAWFLLIVIVSLVHICRKIRHIGTRVEGGAQQEGNRNGDSGDNEFNDNAAIPVGNVPSVEEEMEKGRRSLILRSIIHKTVLASEDDSTLGKVVLPHKETVMKREISKTSFHIAEILENEAMENDWSGAELTDFSESKHDNDNDIGSSSHAGYDFGQDIEARSTALSNNNNHSTHSNINNMNRKKKNLYLKRGLSSMPSLDSAATMYSPTTCAICLDSYAIGDEIAWSHNEMCHHAFHLDCIVDWLMKHDECPMCRLNYLSLENCVDA